jgi:hypothetical protein
LVVVAPAKAGAHTPRPAERARWLTASFQQLIFVVMGPGLRRGDDFFLSSLQHRVGRRAAVGDLQAEQAAEQFDGGTSGAAALVEEGIELDDID